MKKVVLYTLGLVVMLAMALLLYLRANEPNVPERTIIAHAGGNIDSLEYTNSREAVEHAIAGGVKFIELDIVISPEGEPLAFHSSEDMIDTIYSCDPPHMSEFTAAPLRGKNGKTYTPLTWREINEIFLAHPDVTFVVDKTDDPVVLEKFFPKLKDRMVVEEAHEELPGEEISDNDHRAVGDDNGDGFITADDASYVLAYIFGARPLSAEEMKYADIDGNNVVNIVDALMLIYYTGQFN